MSWRSSGSRLWRAIGPLVVGVARRLRRACLTAIEQILPIVSSMIARRHLPDPPRGSIDDAAAHNRVWLSGTGLDADVSDVAAQAAERASRLEAKAAGVLGGLAVLTAVVLGVTFAVWEKATAWERVLLLISGAYSAISLLTGLAALQPRPMFVVTSFDLESAAREQESATRAIAALRLACADANTNGTIRLQNLVAVAGISARNALFFGVVPLLAFAVEHWH